MKTLRELYRIGNGPSSSHTMGPYRAAARFLKQHPDGPMYRVILFGSLAATGRGHMTDMALEKAFNGEKIEILWRPSEVIPLHPNGMRFEVLDEARNVLHAEDEYSIGGGALLSDGESGSIYPEKSMAEIMSRCEMHGERYWEYVIHHEGDAHWDFLEHVWNSMKNAIEEGLHNEGKLPGGLGLTRMARSFFRKSHVLRADMSRDTLLAAYAYAVSEENACGKIVVTAPTCGSCGVLPAVLFYLNDTMHCNRMDILRALATAGLFGNVVKTNGSISGAAVGCQGEVGTACAMAAAAATQILGGSNRQIEYAAEMGLEHHLGLTCDPVGGLVQIPCIERNAHAASRAISCANFAMLSDGNHQIHFDDAVSVMLETGQALPSLYRETSEGGLARIFEKRIETDG